MQQMSQEMEHPTEYGDLGDVVARRLRGPSGAVPSRESAMARLAELLHEVQRRDQESNDVTAEYIRECQDWSDYTRDGTWNMHYCLDTYIDNPDGSVTYIMIDHEIRKTAGQMRAARVTDEEIRQVMLAEIPRLHADEDLDTQDVTDFVVGTAKSAQVTLFKPDAMAYLKDHAVDDTPMIDLLRLNYVSKQVVPPADESVSLPTRDDIYMNEIVHSMVLLQGKIHMRDASELLDEARQIARGTFVESVVHRNEWLELYNRLRYDESVTEPEANDMKARMRQIMDENGYPDVPFDDWRYVLPLESLYGDEVDAETEHVWNQEVFDALLANITGNGLYLESEAIGIRIAAARSVDQRRLGQQAYRLAIERGAEQ